MKSSIDLTKIVKFVFEKCVYVNVKTYISSIGAIFYTKVLISPPRQRLPERQKCHVLFVRLSRSKRLVSFFLSSLHVVPGNGQRPVGDVTWSTGTAEDNLLEIIRRRVVPVAITTITTRVPRLIFVPF